MIPPSSKFFILIVCLASVALADDFKTINGKEYKSAKVSRVEPDGIVITFSGGIVKIPFAELSPEIQKKYGYDPKAATDFQQQTYQADVLRKRAEENAKYWSEHPTPQPPAQRQSEEQIKDEIKEQTGEIERADRSYEEAAQRAKANLEAQKTIREELLKVQMLGIEEDLKTGRITEAGAVVAKYNLQTAASRDNYEATQKTRDLEIDLVKQRATAADKRLESDKIELKSAEDEQFARAQAKGAIAAQEEAYKTAAEAADEGNKKAEEQRSLEEKKADADLKQSKEQFQAAEQRAAQAYQSATKGALSGQVFVAAKGGENFKLSAVQVSLFSRDAIDILLAGLRASADAKIEQVQPQLDTAETAREQAEATVEQAEKAVEQAKAKQDDSRKYYLQSLSNEEAATLEQLVEQVEKAAGQAKAKQDDSRKYYLQSLSNEAGHAAEAAIEGLGTASEALNAAGKAANVVRQRYKKLLEQKAFYYSAAFYFSHLRSPIQTAETDGDGKFVIEFPRTGTFVIAAQEKRNVGDHTERYYWLQPVSLEGKQQRVQNLSNNNLTSATGTSSLVITTD